ncbi:MAG: hypothetical protein SFV32_02475 [Opitutaceae bacterium]|nr:hypothetical protein [Opitutaceae bacterium]
MNNGPAAVDLSVEWPEGGQVRVLQLDEGLVNAGGNQVEVARESRAHGRSFVITLPAFSLTLLTTKDLPAGRK